MLKQRIATALAIAVLFLALLFGLPAQGFALLAIVAVSYGAWEWSHLAGLEGWPARGCYTLFFVFLALAAYLYLAPSAAGADLAGILQVLLAGGIWWAIALLWVQGYPSSAVLWGSVWVRLIMGLFVLLPAWLALALLVALESGRWLVLAVVFIVVAADIGAYFAGHRFGVRKLAEAVSPGKTREGFLGGIVAVLALTVLALVLVPGLGGHWWQWLLVAVFTALASVLGDLVESMVKRHRGVKDSGKLLPGHGGLLDRIDSLSAALPVFTLLYLQLLYSGQP